MIDISVGASASVSAFACVKRSKGIFKVARKVFKKKTFLDKAILKSAKVAKRFKPLAKSMMKVEKVAPGFWMLAGAAVGTAVGKVIKARNVKESLEPMLVIDIGDCNVKFDEPGVTKLRVGSLSNGAITDIIYFAKGVRNNIVEEGGDEDFQIIINLPYYTSRARAKMLLECLCSEGFTNLIIYREERR